MSSWTMPRLNAFIALAGPFIIIFAIKIMNLVLPAKYYFSFSSFAGGSDNVLLIESPSVTGQRLCALVEKYGVSKSDIFSGGEEQCKETLAPDSNTRSGDYERKTTKEQRDAAYRVALATDPLALRKLSEHLANTLAPLSAEELDAMLAENSTPAKAYKAIADKYADLVAISPESPLAAFIAERFGKIIPDESGENGGEAGGNAAERDDMAATAPSASDTPDIVKKALADFVQTVSADSISSEFRSISAADVDNALKEYGALDANIVGHYQALSVSAIKKNLAAAFARNGFHTVTEESIKSAVLKQVAQERMLDYILSVFFRFLPVFLVTAALGFAWGKTETLSISAAGAIAALLLVWPVLILWDLVVQSSWASEKPMFMALYGAYIFAMFLTARAGALGGTYLREKSQWDASAPAESGAGAPKPAARAEATTLRDVSVNLAASLVLNILVFAWNVLIPLAR